MCLGSSWFKHQLLLLVPEIHVVFDECMSYADPAEFTESTRAAVRSSDFPQGLEPPTALIEDLLQVWS